ncbi:uncharacterized protein PRCAT00005159001 [Priceomyces carsonii]|uniref:uncharacterized protein n=1 Tax=Priceomyces carsonii TaxID=28549 RepID=UPI002EDA75D7|nr:unnamed protein product [Priceomyces carsonii]
MKKFLHRPKKAEYEPNKEQHETLQADASSSKSVGSRDTINELQPMFHTENFTNFNNDPSLNLNPSILNGHSNQTMLTKESEYMGKSVFSQSKRTFSTKQSSYLSYRGDGTNSDRMKYRNVDAGQTLQILDIPEDTFESDKTASEIICDKLHELYEDASFVMNQYKSCLINLTTAVINTIECFKRFVIFMDEISTNMDDESWNITTFSNVDLRKIMKVYLHFYDNLLNDDVYVKLKVLLSKNFNDFTNCLNSTSRTQNLEPLALRRPQNFSIGANDGDQLPNEDVLSRIIDKMSKASISMKEQNGSFIAPIGRGISKELNILCLYFGYPNPSDYHYKLAGSLHDLYDDIHFVVMKNQIDLASLKTASSNVQLPQPSTTPSLNTPPSNLQKFKLPFRMPVDPLKPPISMSLSIENSERTSGTMGGYIYPIIDGSTQPHLKSYLNSKFAVSCGHVCLGDSNEYIEYPHVSAPLSVLISLYKQALSAQYRKASQESNGISQIEARAAYGSVLRQLDEMFPLKKIKVQDKKSKTETYVTKNLPLHRFGQIIWGERTLIDVKKMKDGEEVVDKRLSDLAIIKVNNKLDCNQNFLGDDIAFNEFDPGLMFDNLYVRAVIDLGRDVGTLDLNIDEVDSSVSVDRGCSGLPVFKYGSTTKFTKGFLNGIKMVYWLDGRMHSSEFVVNSFENNSSFAAGGDSGSWILAKLEDCKSVPDFKGLGVVGMLHSYDGEFRQFGLFTPMCEILERLEEVTSIRWGVVGVNEKDRDLNGVNDEIASEDDEGGNSGLSESDEASDLDSLVEEFDQVLPPEID